MPGLAVLMREIHRLRRFASDLQEQIDRVPRQLKAQQAKLARQEEVPRETQEAIKRLKISAHEAEVSLKATHGQIGKYEKQLNEAASKKEYDALQLEIKSAREKGQQLEEQILAAMTEGEEKAAQLPDLEANAKQARAEFAAFEKGLNDKLASLKEQMAQTEAQMREAEGQVPESFRPVYNRIVTAKGPDAMTAVLNKTCSACYTEITAQSYADLLAERFVVCKSCGRILYLPEA
jgi:predicted  nucleic acid-binding Zn-ribbon protein